MIPCRQIVSILFLLDLVFLPACDRSGQQGSGSESRVLLATTTSTANTGLLDDLLPAFEKSTGVHVDFVAVGSGAALELGKNGDVDLVLSHAPEAEEEFVRDGFGEARVPVMYNDFVVAGPPSDPASIRRARGAADAFGRIAAGRWAFISRGDDSGTHRKELALWDAAGVDPEGTWRIDAGQGMGACLIMAAEMSAYVLSDRGTYLTRAPELGLEILFDGDPALHNPYSAIAVSPSRRPTGNQGGARALIEWLASPEGQDRISRFRFRGEPLFRPGSGE